MEMHPSSNVTCGENKAGCRDAPKAYLEGVLVSPLQEGSVTTFCGEKGWVTSKRLQCYIRNHLQIE